MTEEKMREALEWYGEQARLARLIHSEGDSGRHALAEDGGKRARAALSTKQEAGREAMSDIVERLRAACNGHPHAKIPWPHRVLHEGADEIERLREALIDARVFVVNYSDQRYGAKAFEVAKKIDLALSVQP